jgi:Ribbon-helix-helix protein, copG family
MPLKSYALSQDLIDGLAELSVRSQVSVNSLVRQAIRRELEREGILVRQSRATFVSASTTTGSDRSDHIE